MKFFSIVCAITLNSSSSIILLFSIQIKDMVLSVKTTDELKEKITGSPGNYLNTYLLKLLIYIFQYLYYNCDKGE